MKTKTIVIIILCALALFASRKYIIDFFSPFFNGGEFTQEQQSAIDDYKEGTGNIFDLLKDKLFSLEDLTDLGILSGENTLEKIGELIDNDNRFSMSDIDIGSLHLEHLSEEQTDMLLKVISGDMTMTQLVTSGKFTLKDLQETGLIDVIINSISNKDN